jgi:hypothetical protein
MATDGFAAAVDHVLLFHREDRPYDPDDYSELCGCRHEFPKWRKHTVELIAAARAKDDQRRVPRAARDVLAAHAPYARAGYAIQCPGCLDSTGCGEFKTIEDWAQHVGDELARAGYRVAKR